MPHLLHELLQVASVDDGLHEAEVVDDVVVDLAGLEVGAVGLEAAAHPAVLNEGKVETVAGKL